MFNGLMLGILLLGSIGQTPIPVNPLGLNWDANSEADLAGYKVYTSTSSKVGRPLQEYDLLKILPLAELEDVTSPKYLFNLSAFFDGNYWAVVSAYDTSDNESGASNEVSFIIEAKDTTPPDAPTGCKIVVNINVNLNK